MSDRKPWSSQGPRKRPPEWFKTKAQAEKRLPKYCAVCGDPRALELDHIIPVAEGGEHTLHNVQWLCPPHHEEKSEQEKLRGNKRRAARRKLPVQKHPGLI
ncbi:HNH endonuclease [Corynebacterium halotolerans]|uniref:HNH endonuclease n=1 Tax=Corynebacterium halotolerans TaxID=225326 RepID=UPI003CF32505